MSLNANLRLEHQLIAVDHDGHVDLMLELAAPAALETPERPPASVAIVVDESSSMAGPKLLAVLRSLTWLAGRLDQRDRAALVGFASEARLLSPLGPVAGLRTALANLRPHGMTNLSGGVLLGLEQLRGAPDDGPRVLLLLTDGHANQGITDATTLTGLAAGAAQAGIRLTTIGFGEGFSEDLLRALADVGRGDAHYAASPEDAPAIFGAELAGLTELAAQNVAVEVRSSEAVTQVDALNDFPSMAMPGGIRIELGDAYAGDVRRLVLRLQAPDLRTLGPCSLAELVVRFTTVGPSPEAHTLTIPVAVNLVSANEAAAQGPDLEVKAEVASLLADRAREEAIRRADAGEHLAAQRLLSSAHDDLRRLGSEAPQLSALRAKAALLAEEARMVDATTYDAAKRKSLSYRAHRSKRNRRRED